MQENRKRLLKSVYTICFSILTVVVGLLFIVQAWSIFRSGERAMYTAASISEHFKQIAVPVVLWMLALVVNIVLGYIYPDEKERVKPYFESKDRVKRVEARLPKDAIERRLQKGDILGLVLGHLALAISLAAMVVCLVYLFSKNYEILLPEAFFNEHNGIADRLVRVLVWSSAGMMLLMAAVIMEDYLARKREERLKRAFAQLALKRKQAGEKVALIERKDDEKSCKLCKILGSKQIVWGVRAALAIVAIVFIITGIANGGMAGVLQKAINICTQCIGLG